MQTGDLEKRDKWVEQLLLTVSCDAYVDSGDTTALLPSRPKTFTQISKTQTAVAIPVIEYTTDHDCESPTILERPKFTKWLEPIKTDDGSSRSRHRSLRRQLSSDSDFPRSRSASLDSNRSRGGTSESGYSSSDVSNSKSPSRSTSHENMSEWDGSPPASPVDTTETIKPFLEPVCP